MYDPALLLIHVPARGTTCSFNKKCLRIISIHVPAGGTTTMPRAKSALSYFNPRAHGGHDATIMVDGLMSSISIHVPTGGTTCNTSRLRIPLRFQSTCPRGARRDVLCCIRFGVTISIHVPTRGTTSWSVPAAEKGEFQSTCPRGARLATLTFIYDDSNFNPRAHEGHDLIDVQGVAAFHFNPRAHEGHDLLVAKYQLLLQHFNPRAHEGHDFPKIWGCRL